MNIKSFKFEEGTFSKNAQSVGKIYHEVLLLKKFLQTKRPVKEMNFKYYDLYYTVIKNRDDKDNPNNKNGNNEINYNNYDDIITRNHYIGIKPRETILK